MLDNIFPVNPNNQQAEDIIDNEDEAHFAPVVEWFCHKHGIEYASYCKINGWGNILLDIDNKWILKISAPNWAVQQNREIEALKLLAGHSLPVAVPRLFHHGEYNGWVYFITDKLPGTNLHELWPELNQPTKLRLMNQVGSFAKALNDLPVKAEGLLAVDWQDFIQTYSAGAYEKRKKQGLDGPLLEQIKPFLQQVNYQGEFGHPRLIHCDLHAANLLAQQVDGQWQLSGVIDFGDALISSDIHYELTATTILMGLGDKTLNQAFFDGYGLHIEDPNKLQQILMVLSIIRHSGEMQYVLNQVEGCADLTDWQAVAERFFAL